MDKKRVDDRPVSSELQLQQPKVFTCALCGLSAPFEDFGRFLKPKRSEGVESKARIV